MSTSFHPDKNLPGCMMPDGGEACAGYVALVDDWHKLRNSHAELVRALEEIRGGSFLDAAGITISGDWKKFTERLQEIARAARAKLPPAKGETKS